MKKPTFNYTKRYDTNYSKNPKKFKGIAGRVTPAEVVICTEDVKTFNENLSLTIEEATDNSVVEINDVVIEVASGESEDGNSLSTDTSIDSNDLSEGGSLFEIDDETISMDDTEINGEPLISDFSALSLENTKKELVEYATLNGVVVKDWWGKQKILDAISSK